MKKFDNYIGIDPDVDKSGVAFIEAKIGKMEIANLAFFDLMDYLKWVSGMRKKLNESVLVRVECGFLNGGNWHMKTNGSSAINAKIGQRTGANHEVAKKICEMCAHLGIDYEQVKPTKSKVNANFFKQVTGVMGRTNQEQRDAGMLIARYVK